MSSLSIKGYCIEKDALDSEDLTEIREKLCVKPYNMMDLESDKSFAVFRESSKKIYIPKFYGLQCFGQPENDDLANMGKKINCSFKGALREEQKAPVTAFLAAAKDPEKRGGIISLQCAAGKTVMALYIACRLGVKTMVVVHKEFLLNQWKERISQFVPDAKVGYIKGPVCDQQEKDIVIASLQSLSMKTYDTAIFRDFGFVIYDEVHHSAAHIFSRVFYKVTTQYTLGLSATVQRKDGLTKVFKWHIGDVVYRNKKKADSMRVIIKEYYDVHSDYSRPYMMFNKKPNMSKMINNICDFLPRTKFIVACLQELLESEPNRKVLILSDRRKHLEVLKDELSCVNISSGFYYGGLKQEVLLESEKQQVLLGTYSYVSEGFDMKGLNTMILASPKSDIVQSVGRITRDLVQDREYEPCVIDIVDNFSIFPNQAKKRIKYYESQKYEIVSDKLYRHLDPKEFSGKCHIRTDE